jgi:hypothetical protein
MLLTDGVSSVEITTVELHRKLLDWEIEHKLSVGNTLQPNVPFLTSVAQYLARRGLNVTLSGAWQAWRAICLYVDLLRKRHAIDADIAHWFGVDPFGLTESQKVALVANIDRVQAQQILNAGNYSNSDYQTVHDLTLLATGSKAMAEQARSIALKRYVDSQIAKEKHRNA